MTCQCLWGRKKTNKSEASEGSESSDPVDKGPLFLVEKSSNVYQEVVLLLLQLVREAQTID